MPDLIIHLDALGLRRGGLIALTRGSVALEPRILQAGAGIEITNPSGASGDPTFAVDTSALDATELLALIAAASDTVAGKIEIAIQSEMEAGSDATRAVTPGRQHYHPSAAKCWAVVSVSAGTPSLDASYNITSITDTGTGQLTITIGTDFSSSDWAAICTLFTGTDRFAQIASRAAGSVQIDVWDVSGAGVTGDPLGYSFVGFGDQ